jgi:hypothetical protein
MDSKALKASWIIVLIVMCVIAINGLIIMIVPEVFTIGEYEGYTGGTWEGYSPSNPAAASFFRLENNQMGWYIFILGVIGILITILYYKKEDRPSWYILLILQLMSWAGTIVYDIPTHDTGTLMILGIFLIIGLDGLGIGAKPILKG